MTSKTEYFGLTKLAPNEGLHAGDGRFPSSDRDTIDQALYDLYTHRHVGGGASTAPATPPTLTVGTGGTIPASTTVRYKYTYWDSTSGETPASSEAFIVTPDPIASPGAGTAVVEIYGGLLEPGIYYYAVSAYQGSTTVETKAGTPVEVEVPVGTSTNMVTLTLPALPAGADGYNVYRRAPNQSRYSFQVSIPSGATEFVDDGSGTTIYDIIEYDGGGVGASANLDRTLPTNNTTNSTNSVSVTVDGVPAGNQWVLYRTTSLNYSNSYLAQVPEAQLTYTDVGVSTSAGSPPSISLAPPSKIDLTDGAEVQGILPMSMNSYPDQVEFSFPGPVAPVNGTGIWVCEFPYAEIVAVRAALGRGSRPASTPVIVDVLRGTAASVPTYTTIFPTTTNPSILPGDQVGVRVVPDLVSMVQGESLVVNIDQAGGGEPATDRDLIVTISMILYGYPVTTFVPVNPAVTPGSF